VKRLSRRALIAGGGLAIGGVAAANWKMLSQASGYHGLLEFGDRFNMHAQRLAMWSRPLVPEYRPDQITPNHPVNGGFGASYVDPDPGYSVLVKEGFRSWRLVIDGLVRRPLSLSLPEILSLPMRSQITMHSCDEGWSAIAKWSGVQLSEVLARSGVLPGARYVVFHCMDKIAGTNVYTSIDLLDAMHPQTLLAYRFNDQPLPVGHGAPLRLRIELQIGYKNAKHIQRIELTDSLAHIGQGKGGLFEDYGYQWYAGM
jgi:DMSO/TMAO reductase YedYZ molybdopterin-dependent catalytic subunit